MEHLFETMQFVGYVPDDWAKGQNVPDKKRKKEEGIGQWEGSGVYISQSGSGTLSGPVK
jgi:hypothetical protein